MMEQVPCGTPRRRWVATVDGEIATIPLTRGYIATIDASDLPLVSDRAWYAHLNPHTVYARSNSGEAIGMHTLIGGGLVDHRDRDGLNNRRANLRPATEQQNKRRRISTRGSQPYKGAAFHKSSGLFHSTIVVDGCQKSLGYFKDPADAARAYDAAAVEHFGDFALTNKELGLL